MLSLPRLPALLLLVASIAIALSACTTPPTSNDASAEWHAVALPGKQPTDYRWTRKDGRAAIAAVSESSASMYRRRVHVAADALGTVGFSWWVQDLIANASVADIDREDAPARVLLGFAGDTSKLPMRTRALFELAEVLTGETPPYATLMYVWDAHAPVGSVIVNPRSDRIRKIVVDSGPAQLQRWRDHKRDIVADFKLAFGEAPGALQSVAVMTDSDNTRSKAVSWYGNVVLTD